MADLLEHQREITRLLLLAIDDVGFALAGSGAIREHGVSERPTEDVELFTTKVGAQRFGAAVDQGRGHTARARLPGGRAPVARGSSCVCT